MDYIIDRIEGDFAVCQSFDGGETINVKRNTILGNIREGGVIVYCNGNYFFDEEKTKEREMSIKKSFDSLWESL